MKRIILLYLCLLITLTSCVGYSKLYTIIPQQTADQIPLKSEKVIISNRNKLEQNYRNSYLSLLDLDFKIEGDNKEMGYIRASKMDMGDTYVRLNVICADDRITISSEWKPGSTSAMYAEAMSGLDMDRDWDKAQWNRAADKPSVAFAKAVELASKLGGEIGYQYPAPKRNNKLADPVYY